jgi:hypothetical protein
MGSPQQIATAERLLTRARQDLEKQYLVDLRLCEVPAALFERDVAPLLPKADGVPAAAPAPHATVLDDAAARALVTTLKKGADVKITQFPQIVAPSLHLARLRVGDQVAYVRDFEIEVAAAAFIANPIVDVLFHGYDVDLMCCEVRAGTLGVQLQLVDQVLEQPIRTIETTVPGSTLPVTVQVPRLAGCRGSQTVEMQNGATAVMAARKNATTWLVSLMTPQQIRSAPAALPVRR